MKRIEVHAKLTALQTKRVAVHASLPALRRKREEPHARRKGPFWLPLSFAWTSARFTRSARRLARSARRLAGSAGRLAAIALRLARSARRSTRSALRLARSAFRFNRVSGDSRGARSTRKYRSHAEARRRGGGMGTEDGGLRTEDGSVRTSSARAQKKAGAPKSTRLEIVPHSVSRLVATVLTSASSCAGLRSPTPTRSGR